MKTLISDFDGTLYDSNFENNISKIIEFVSKNNNFILSTGRNYQNIKDYIVNYNIPCKYLICSDGAVIYDQNGKIIYEKYMDNDLKLTVVNNLIADKEISEVLIDTNRELIKDYSKKASRVFAKIDNKEYGFIKQKEILDKFNVTTYLSTTGLNILPLDINKVCAIKYLETIQDLGEIYTVGDSFNDIEMLNNYKGFIMKNNSINKHNFIIVESVSRLIDIIEKDI